jgi:hypothetical protein
VYRKPQLLHAATRAWTRTYWTGLPIASTVKNKLLVRRCRLEVDVLGALDLFAACLLVSSKLLVSGPGQAASTGGCLLPPDLLAQKRLLFQRPVTLILHNGKHQLMTYGTL